MRRANFTKTKILGTIGPATATVDKLCELLQEGLDGIRLNFSHGTHKDFEKIFSTIREVCIKESAPIPILVDLQGPKIRIGELEKPEIEIKTGNEIEITSDDVLGNDKLISCSYKSLVNDAQVGNIILIDDGLLHLKVIKKTDKVLRCKIKAGGTLRPRKGMNLPGMQLSTPALTEQDKDNLEFALKHRVDFVALSFVRKADDIKELKAFLKKRKKEIPIIAKIEKEEAIENFEQILAVSDGIMVARGDLGVELSPQSVPILQKNIIRKCNSEGKIVITATQMLESMVSNPVPTRAEASDVANAVLDGTDVVMLSAETSVGKFPKETITVMNNIISQTEVHNDLKRNINFKVPLTLDENLFDSVGRGITEVAKQLEAQSIVVFTNFGKKAKLIAKFKPECKVYAFTNSFDVMNNLNLHAGITPIFLKNIDEEENAIKESTKILKKRKLIKKNDLVIYTAGSPTYRYGRRHWLQFSVI